MEEFTFSLDPQTGEVNELDSSSAEVELKNNVREAAKKVIFLVAPRAASLFAEMHNIYPCVDAV